MFKLVYIQLVPPPIPPPPPPGLEVDNSILVLLFVTALLYGLKVLRRENL